MEKYDVSKASAQGDTVIKDVDKGFVRAMDSSIAMVRPGSPSYTFQPPTHSTDWVREVASHMLRTYRNITPTSREVCHSTDYTSHSTDCQGLPDKNALPDVARLPDVEKTVFLARVGRGIVGSEKTTRDAAVTEPEVAGQPRWSQHTGGPD